MTRKTNAMPAGIKISLGAGARPKYTESRYSLTK